MTKKQILQMAQDAGFANFAIPPDVAEVFYRFATLVRNAALEEVAALGRIGDRVKNPALVEFVGEIYELKEPTP